MGDQDPNTLGTLKCGIVDCTSLKIGGTEFPANAASNSNQQILPADPQNGDMLFWNGSNWGLVKAESVSDGALLTLKDGVLMWKSYNIQADQTRVAQAAAWESQVTAWVSVMDEAKEAASALDSLRETISNIPDVEFPAFPLGDYEATIANLERLEGADASILDQASQAKQAATSAYIQTTQGIQAPATLDLLR